MASSPKTTTWKSGNMDTIIAKLDECGSVYFQKLLGISCKRKFSGKHKFGRLRSSSMGVPAWFAHTHAHNFQTWAHIRTKSSPTPWRVRFTVYKEASPNVRVNLGWKRFVDDNRLNESVVFVLSENVRNVFEYQVYIFRGEASRALRGTSKKRFVSKHGTDYFQPSFSKPIVVTNRDRFEVPASFLRPHGMHLREGVGLQGLHQHSLVRTVICRHHMQGK